ncbi:MAG: hypothetical protein ABWZ80_10195 [Beijerinckiaceae bacterium]
MIWTCVAAALGLAAGLAFPLHAFGEGRLEVAQASHLLDIPGWRRSSAGNGGAAYVCVEDQCGRGTEISFRKLNDPIRSPDDFTQRVRQSAELAQKESDGDIVGFDLERLRFWREDDFEFGEVTRTVHLAPTVKKSRQRFWTHAYVSWNGDSYMVLSSARYDAKQAYANIRVAFEAIRQIAGPPKA